MGKPLIDLTGKTFGRLSVIEKSGNSGGKSLWKCACLCGKEVVVRGVHLRQGRQVSCGCYRSENTSKRLTKHGHSKNGKISPTYIVWQNMIYRCNPENANLYPHYKHVHVCDKWKSFEGFLEDMGERPEGLTIDRIDGTLGYFKENCRWTDMATQNRNRKDNVWLNIDGEVMCRADAMKMLGLKSIKSANNYARKNNLFLNSQLVELTS